MPTNRTRIRRTSSGGRLTAEELWYLEAGFDLDGLPSGLEGNPTRAQQLWRGHREEVLARSYELGWKGWRPHCFWEIEIGHRPPTEPERLQYLRDNGLLRADELVYLNGREQELRVSGLDGPFERAEV